MSEVPAGDNGEQRPLAEIGQKFNDFSTKKKHRLIHRNYKFKRPVVRIAKEKLPMEEGIRQLEFFEPIEAEFCPEEDVMVAGEDVENYLSERLFENNKQLDPQIRANLKHQKFIQLTNVQRAVIPHILGGSFKGYKKDLIVCARSGSGKTLAFMIPVINYCQLTLYGSTENRKEYHRGAHRASVLILLKGTYAAYQVYQRMKSLAFNTDVIIKPLIGKISNDPIGQDGCDIIVATQGRLLDHLGEDENLLHELKCFIFDDADFFMSEFDWQKAVTLYRDNLLNTSAQIVCLSSGYDQLSIEAFTNFVKDDHVFIDMAALNQVESTIHQRFIDCGFKNKTEMLEKILLEKSVENRYPKTIIYCSSKEVATLLSHRLMLSSNLPDSFRPRVDYCHGGQIDPIAVFKIFNTPKGVHTDDNADDGMEIDVIVACDGLSYGVLTIAELVINFEFPLSLCYYASRMGRLNRNTDGEIITFVDSRVLRKCPRRIENSMVNVLRAAYDAKAYIPPSLQGYVLGRF